MSGPGVYNPPPCLHPAVQPPQARLRRGTTITLLVAASFLLLAALAPFPGAAPAEASGLSASPHPLSSRPGTSPSFQYRDLSAGTSTDGWLGISALSAAPGGVEVAGARTLANALELYNVTGNSLTDQSYRIPGAFQDPRTSIRAMGYDPLCGSLALAGENGTRDLLGVVNTTGTSWDLGTPLPRNFTGAATPSLGPLAIVGGNAVVAGAIAQGEGLLSWNLSTGLLEDLSGNLPPGVTGIAGISPTPGLFPGSFTLFFATPRGPELGLMEPSSSGGFSYHPLDALPSNWTRAGVRPTAFAASGRTLFVALVSPRPQVLLGEIPLAANLTGRTVNLTGYLSANESCPGCAISALVPTPGAGLFVAGENPFLYAVPVADAGFLNLSSGTYTSLTTSLDVAGTVPFPHLAGAVYAGGSIFLGGGFSPVSPGAEFTAYSTSSGRFLPLSPDFSQAPDPQGGASQGCTSLLGGYGWQAPSVEWVDTCQGVARSIAPPSAWDESGSWISEWAVGPDGFLAVGTRSALDPTPLLGLFEPQTRDWTVLGAGIPGTTRGYYMASFGGQVFLLEGYDFQYNGVLDALDPSTGTVTPIQSGIASYNVTWWGDDYNGSAFILVGSALVNCRSGGTLYGGEVEIAAYVPSTNASSTLARICLGGAFVKWAALDGNFEYLVGSYGAPGAPGHPYFARYDLTNGSYANLSGLIPPGWSPQVVSSWSGEIWMGGTGSARGGSGILAQYDPQTGGWEDSTGLLPAGVLQDPRVGVSALVPTQNGLLVAGPGVLGLLATNLTGPSNASSPGLAALWVGLGLGIAGVSALLAVVFLILYRRQGRSSNARGGVPPPPAPPGAPPQSRPYSPQR